MQSAPQGGPSAGVAGGEAGSDAEDVGGSFADQGAVVAGVDGAAVSETRADPSDDGAPTVAEAPPRAEVLEAQAEAVTPRTSHKEPKLVEIWRPRRRSRGERVHKGQGALRRDTGEANSEQEASGRGRPHRQHRPERKGRPERRKEEQRRTPDDRARAETRSASPPRRGGVDPDSPFAALGALKSELEKRAKEQGTP